MRAFWRSVVSIGIAGCGGTTAPTDQGVATVFVTPVSATLTTFDSVALTATARNAAGQQIGGRTATWTSSDTTRAVVSPLGVVHTLRPGGVVIKAVIDTAAGQATLSITPSVVRVDVQAGDDSVRVGDSLQFTVTLYGSGGKVITGRAITWSSSDSAAAMVSPSGLVRGLSEGASNITATAEGVVGSKTLGIMAAVDTVAIVPVSVTLGIGSRVTLRARLVDSTGAEFLGLAVGWSTSNLARATIDTGGVLSALTSGTDTLYATSERRTGFGTATIRVVNLLSVGPGDVHTCAVSSDQMVFCWGGGGARIGDSAASQADGPVAVVGGQSYVDVENGVEHSCGLTATGKAFCWGSDIYDQLGQATRVQSTFPVPVQGGLTFKWLGVGYFYACGLTTDSVAYCWGNGYGATPVPVPGNLRFAHLSTGGGHSCGLVASGAAYCWGANDEGELGDSTRTSRSTPAPVVGGLLFSTISAGGYHTCALTTAGSAYCWGYGALGEIGIDSVVDINLTPAAVHGGLTFSAITLGLYNTCGLASGGDVYCWGSNTYGESGPNAGPLNVGRSLVPVPVGIAASVVAAGTKHVCAETSNGLYCWGSDGSGELGDGGRTDSAIPVRVLSQP